MNSLPFERLEGESEKAFSAFLIFALLPPDIRSVKRAQDEFYKNSPLPSRKAGQASRGWQSWSSKFHWGKRASLLDQQKSLEFIELEKQLWLETKQNFNQIGELKQSVQLKLETLFLNFLEDAEKKGFFSCDDNDLSEVGDRIEQVSKIQKILCEGDKILYDRFLKSVGIESLLE